MPANGNPSAISTAAARAASVIGRRITKCENRYQKPEVSAMFVGFCCHRRGASQFTRVPSRRITAGRTVDATAQAIRATITPAAPIDHRKLILDTVIDAAAAAIVSELKRTVPPAV